MTLWVETPWGETVQAEHLDPVMLFCWLHFRAGHHYALYGENGPPSLTTRVVCDCGETWNRATHEPATITVRVPKRPRSR